MSVLYVDVLSSWVTKWRSLVAWGAALAMPITLKEREHRGRVLGRAFPEHGNAIIFMTGDLGEDLGTALHEMAHLAAPTGTGHGKRWREMYARAACEALGISDRFGWCHNLELAHEILDDEVVLEIQAWLGRTGQRAFLSSLGVIS